MTRVVLSRHGESVWHQSDRYAGRTDIGLTERGRDHAASLSAWAREARPDAIWTSPLSRCRDTAAPAAMAIGLTARVEERLTELDFGRVEGMARGQLVAEHREIYDAFCADPVAHHFPDGEHPARAATRVTAALRDAALETPGGCVLVVGHSTALRLALCELLGIPLNRYRATFPRLDNAGLTELELLGRDASLLTLNRPLAAPSQTGAL